MDVHWERQPVRWPVWLDRLFRALPAATPSERPSEPSPADDDDEHTDFFDLEEITVVSAGAPPLDDRTEAQPD